MRRSRIVLFAAVSAVLVAFGLVADRALEGQARRAREVADESSRETVRLTAASIGAALTRLEQDVLAGRTGREVSVQRAFAEPPASVPEPSSVEYRRRPRADLAALLLSTRVTSSGLPEAIVALIALEYRAAISGEHETVRRFLEGDLPVRRADISVLAGILGVGGDPRVAQLQDRLRRAPDADALPPAPRFRRRHVDDGIEGWTHDVGRRIRYQVPLGALLARAQVPPSTVAAATTSVPLPHSPLPDVEGLSVHVPAAPPAVHRIRALRLALWAAVGTSIVGLIGVRRALAAEARANAREKAFLTAVTHELRTPLAAIRLFGETLAEGRGNARDYGALVAEECHRLESLVERVLAATRAGEKPRFAETAPDDVLRSALALIAPRAERRAVRLTGHADGSLPTALWDADAVRRALLNLLDNAVKHGREGGTVEVRAEARGDVVDLSVRDDGPGIGPRERKGLFQRFARGATEAPGTGLGLHLAEQVARAHGGRVELVTAEGQGCTFILRLPARPPQAGGAATA